MSKDRATIGTDGRPLPVLPPPRDARVWSRACRVMFYTPGFLALLLVKAGDPTGFGVSVELLMLASAAAVVGALFIGTQSDGTGADTSSRVGTWSGGLVLELLAVVPLLAAVPSLFHELVNSELLHSLTGGPSTMELGPSQLIPAAAILPFMLYQLAGFGTLHFVLPKALNWVVNLGILALIVTSYVANRQGNFDLEMWLVGVLVLAMVLLVFYGVLKLRRMQEHYDAFHPAKGKSESAVPDGV